MPMQNGAENHDFEDTIFKLGHGYDSITSTLKPSPFCPSWVAVPEPGSPETTTSAGWDETSRMLESGERLDVQANIRLWVTSLNFSSNWQASQQAQEYVLTYQVQTVKDYGAHWIDTSTLQLTREAEQLLAKSPMAFRAHFGDRFTIAERRRSHITCRLRMKTISATQAQSLGLHMSASGHWVTGGFSASANYSSFMRNAVSQHSAEVYIRSNVRGGDLEAMVINNPQDMNNIIAQFAALRPRLDEMDQQGNPVAKPRAYGSITVPMSFVVPAVEDVPGPTPGMSLDDEFRRFLVLDSRQRRLQAIYEERSGLYSFLGDARIRELKEALVTTRKQTAEIAPRIKELLLGKPVPELPSSDLPEVRWPLPRIERVFAELWRGVDKDIGDAYSFKYYIRIHDCAGLVGPAPGVSEYLPFHFLCSSDGTKMMTRIYGYPQGSQTAHPGTQPKSRGRVLPDGTQEFLVQPLYWQGDQYRGFRPETWKDLPIDKPFRIVVGADAQTPVATLDMVMNNITSGDKCDVGWTPDPF